MEISRYEHKRRQTKNGLFIYSKKNKRGKRNVFYFSKEEDHKNFEELYNIFELECEQLRFIY